MWAVRIASVVAVSSVSEIDVEFDVFDPRGILSTGSRLAMLADSGAALRSSNLRAVVRTRVSNEPIALLYCSTAFPNERPSFAK